MVRRWRRETARTGPVVKRMEPIRLAGILREYAGLWVALRDGKVVEAGETPDQLVMALQRRAITDATIMRAPGPEEPELVGLG